MISRYMSIACSSHDRYIDIRIGLFIVNMIHIYNVRIHWRLLVKFSCDSYEILCSWVCLNNLLVILTSSCHNTIEISSLANICLLLQHWLRYFKKSVSVIILKLGGLNPKAFKSIVLLNMLGKLIEKMIAR